MRTRAVKGVCKTRYGVFRINIDQNKISVIGANLCANIDIHNEESIFSWQKTTNGGCELTESDITAGISIKIADAAFTLLRKHFPEKRGIVSFLDDTALSIQKSRINFMKAYLLLHRKTWYEDKLGATMCDTDIYSEFRKKADKNFDDPAKKPAAFDFGQAAKFKLEPLYKDSKTWGEFIGKFVEAYGNEKYELIEEWYRRALYIIFDGIEINQNWCIDISKRLSVELNIIRLGGRTTRKNQKHDNFMSELYTLQPYYFEPNNL